MKLSRKRLFQTHLAVRSLLANQRGVTLSQDLVSRLFTILEVTEPYVEFRDLRRRAIAEACGLDVSSRDGAIRPKETTEDPGQAIADFEKAWREYEVYEEECDIKPVPASEIVETFNLSYLDLYTLGAAVDLST